MQQTTIACDARLPSGGICGQSAIVHAAQNYYDNVMYRPGAGGEFDAALRETHFDIECSVCGRRTQIVKAGR